MLEGYGAPSCCYVGGIWSFARVVLKWGAGILGWIAADRALSRGGPEWDAGAPGCWVGDGALARLAHALDRALTVIIYYTAPVIFFRPYPLRTREAN